MVKTKGGRLMNPTDAFRKEQRKKEIQRNKLERKYQREAHRRINDPVELKQELQRVLEAEKDGMLNKTLRLKKKVLQEAYDQALKRKKEEELRKKRSDQAEASTVGPSSSNPEESRYYHPTLNPSGAPPPGKVNAFQCPVPSSVPAAMRPPSKVSLPIPAPPPLPPGPAPLGMMHLPPPPAAPPLPPGPAPHPPGVPPPLPPPLTPPPGYNRTGRTMEDVDVLPPPPGPPPDDDDSDAEDDAPPGMHQHPVMPPPAGPPPSSSYTRLPLPRGPALSHPQAIGRLPPPLIPPPSYNQQRPQGAGPAPISLPPAPQQLGKRETKTTITGASTVIKRPLAQNDRALTSMVPASVRVRREATKPKPRPSIRKPDIAPAYGLVPVSGTSAPSAPPKRRPSAPATTSSGPSMEQKIMDFMEVVKELGAFENT